MISHTGTETRPRLRGEAAAAMGESLTEQCRVEGRKRESSCQVRTLGKGCTTATPRPAGAPPPQIIDPEPRKSIR